MSRTIPTIAIVLGSYMLVSPYVAHSDRIRNPRRPELTARTRADCAAEGDAGDVVGDGETEPWRRTQSGIELVDN